MNYNPFQKTIDESNGYIEQCLADVDVNAKVQGKTVHVDRDDVQKAKATLKKKGYASWQVVGDLNEELQRIEEKKLTDAEMKKREEVAKAMERENPGMNVGKKMAIATSVAKKVAEEVGERYSILPESFGQVQELSKDKLVDYTHKSFSDANRLHKELADEQDPEKKKELRDRISKRNLGVIRAVGKASTKESVEPIEELSRSGTISRYLRATRPEHNTPEENEKRRKGRNLALKKKWGNKEHGFEEPKVKGTDESFDLEDFTPEEIEEFMQTEDFDRLDELSKKTLGNYVKKATRSVNTMAGKIKDDEARQERLRKARHDVDDKEDLKALDRQIAKSANTEFRTRDKRTNRVKGVDRAVSRLTKEDTELDEAVYQVDHKHGRATVNARSEKEAIHKAHKNLRLGKIEPKDPSRFSVNKLKEDHDTLFEGKGDTLKGSVHSTGGEKTDWEVNTDNVRKVTKDHVLSQNKHLSHGQAQAVADHVSKNTHQPHGYMHGMRGSTSTRRNHEHHNWEESKNKSHGAFPVNLNPTKEHKVEVHHHKQGWMSEDRKVEESAVARKEGGRKMVSAEAAIRLAREMAKRDERKAGPKDLKKAAAHLRQAAEAVDHSKEHIEQMLADHDINASVSGNVVKVHKDNVHKARRVIKKMGHPHTVVGGLNESELNEISNEAIDKKLEALRDKMSLAREKERQKAGYSRSRSGHTAASEAKMMRWQKQYNELLKQKTN